MKRFAAFILISLFAFGCSKDDDGDSPSGGTDPKDPKLSAMGSNPDGSSGAGGPIRNRYAEKNWKEEELEENEWTEQYAAAKTTEERLTVLGRKQSSGPEQLSSLIRRALRDKDERVRIEAVQMLTSFVTLPDEVVDLVMGGVNDPSSEVRALTMESIIELLPETRLEAYKSTIAAPDETVRLETIKELGRIYSKPSFETLMTGLQHPDLEFRARVNEEIQNMTQTQREFQSYTEARDWWDVAQEHFGDNMVQIRDFE